MLSDNCCTLKDLPPILSGEQVRKVLHISKRKCAWMLNNGYIKCENTGKKSRKYYIKLTDLLEFIADSDQHPEKYLLPYGMFSAGEYNKPQPKRKYNQYGFPKKMPKGFANWLEKEFENVADVLTPCEIMSLTGYSDNAVNRWLSRGWLKSVQSQKGKVVAKEWLIEFYCDYGSTIAKMSDEHIMLVRRFLKL